MENKKKIAVITGASSGMGREFALRIDGEEIPVVPGDVVRIPVDAMHTVINLKEQELLWAAFWWPVMD